MGRLAMAVGALLLVGVLWTPNAFGQEFIRGDLDQNFVVDLADFTQLSEMLFGGGAMAPCLDAADANDDGILDILDILDLLRSMFGSFAMPAPTGSCGPDPTVDSLFCGGIACP